MKKYIVDQDREHIYQYDEDRLSIRYAEHDGVRIGINIMYDENLLATYDTLARAVKELANMNTCCSEVYAMQEE